MFNQLRMVCLILTLLQRTGILVAILIVKHDPHLDMVRILMVLSLYTVYYLLSFIIKLMFNQLWILKRIIILVVILMVKNLYMVRILIVCLLIYIMVQY